jgi:hypothetical protein
MRATVRSVRSADVWDLENWHPADPSCFGFPLEIDIGSVGGPGADTFQVIVCSPSWFEAEMNTAVHSGQHTLFMRSYDYRALRAYIDKRVHAVEGANWSEIADQLRYFAFWEFEGYRELNIPQE